MLDFLYKKIEPHATCKMGIILFILGLICKFGFDWRIERFGVGNQALDGRLLKGQIWYCPADVVVLFNKLKEANNLWLYGISELTLDVLFPIVYTSLFACLIIRLFSAKRATYLILLPILAGLSDLLENFTIAFLALTFNGNPSPVAYLVPIFSGIKWLFSGISLFVILIGLILILKKNYPNSLLSSTGITKS